MEFGKWNIFTYDAARERRDMLQAYPSYILFALELAFMVLLLFLYVKKHRPGQLYPFVCFVLLSLVWVSPLYILGADWFRWNHIYALLLVILLLTGLHEHRKGQPRINGRFNRALLLINLVFLWSFIFTYGMTPPGIPWSTSGSIYHIHYRFKNCRR